MVDAGSLEAGFRAWRIRDSNHIEGTPFAVAILIPAEVSAGEREEIISHEEVFHPGIGDNVIVVLQNDVVWSNPSGEEFGGREGFERRFGFWGSEKGVSVIGEAGGKRVSEDGCQEQEGEEGRAVTAKDADEPGESDSADYANRKGKIGADTVGGDIQKYPAGPKRHDEENEGPCEYQTCCEGAAKGDGNEDKADDAERETDLSRCFGYLVEGESDAGELGRCSDGRADSMCLDVGRHRHKEKEETREEQEDEWVRLEEDGGDSGKKDFEMTSETDDRENEGSYEDEEEYERRKVMRVGESEGEEYAETE